MTSPSSIMPTPRSQPLRGGPVLRWGVVAPGGIAADFVHALHAHTDQRVVAVASRSSERAAEFAERHGIPRSYGDYWDSSPRTSASPQSSAAGSSTRRSAAGHCSTSACTRCG